MSKELSKEYKLLLKPLLEKLIIIGVSSKYTRAEREYIFACISKKNNCAYCYHMHNKFANENGINDQQKKNIHYLLTQQLDNETDAITSFAALANCLVKINGDQ